MKICIFDHLGVHKTTKEIERWFASHGHEVRWNMYYDMREKEEYIEWCDVALFEWLEGMVETCLRDGWGKKKPIYARAMDIEIWANNSNGADWSDLTGLAYTSKYLFSLSDQQHNFSQYPNLKLAHIPLSIEMDQWPYKERHGGYNIGVLGHMWDSKGPNLIPQFARYLIDKTGNNQWKFYVQGNWRHDVWRWYINYFQYIVKELGLENNIFINEDRVDDLDKWYDQMNYLVTFSMKDAFSIPVAEAMAKGIKAIPHNFPGSKDIWGKYVWSTFDELYYKITNEIYDSNEYYQFVKTHYSNEVIMKKWADFMGIKSES